MNSNITTKFSNEEQSPDFLVGAVSSRSILESDKRIVYQMATTLAYHTIMDAYSIENIFRFGETAEIINKLNYMTVINRLRKALESLWQDDRCERFKDGRGYSYNFTKSLGNGY